LNFVQDNQSSSRKGVLRGLHYQVAPYAQSKLVRVLSGVILDVVVDLRTKEKTFGKHFSMELSAENKKQVLIPKGFAHGFITLSDQAEVFYKCDEYYHPEADRGILFSDPALAINWKLGNTDFILSEKDKKHPILAGANLEF
jgi:dTDP-4-dehydrorhamnose 3,5-epimerase